MRCIDNPFDIDDVQDVCIQIVKIESREKFLSAAGYLLRRTVKFEAGGCCCRRRRYSKFFNGINRELREHLELI